MSDGDTRYAAVAKTKLTVAASASEYDPDAFEDEIRALIGGTKSPDEVPEPEPPAPSTQPTSAPAKEILKAPARAVIAQKPSRVGPSKPVAASTGIYKPGPGDAGSDQQRLWVSYLNMSTDELRRTTDALVQRGADVTNLRAELARRGMEVYQRDIGNRPFAPFKEQGE